MKTSEAFWQFLPEGLDELFEMVKFEKTDQAYDIWLDPYFSHLSSSDSE